MKTIARTRLSPCEERGSSSAAGAAPWPEIAARAQAWCTAQSVLWRDVVVLVPFLEVLAPARRAFASVGAWMPRIETTRTLARSLGPPAAAGTERGFDSALDTLLAKQLLARQKWGAEWSRRDRRGFERAAARVAATAHDLAQAAHALAPAHRAEWWEKARAALSARGGPGGRERMLAHVALEWAAAAPAPDTDRLFELQPSAWILIEAGGRDPLAASVAVAGSAPLLVIDTDVSLDAPFAAYAAGAAGGADAAGASAAPAFALCDGFEDEASAAAAQVLDHLARDERPVALVAQDRVLVRRVRALLERSGVALADESGWKLATTRAGSAVMALLAAARPIAAADAYFSWLKSAPMAADAHPHALAALEAECRRKGVTRRSGVRVMVLKGAAAALRDSTLAVLEDFIAAERRPLSHWLDALATALERSGSLEPLRRDAAGRQALAALGIEPPLAPERRQAIDADIEALGLAEFTAWVDEVFEGVTFRPPDGTGNAGDAIDAGSQPLAAVDAGPKPLDAAAGSVERAPAPEAALGAKVRPRRSEARHDTDRQARLFDDAAPAAAKPRLSNDDHEPHAQASRFETDPSSEPRTPPRSADPRAPLREVTGHADAPADRTSGEAAIDVVVTPLARAMLRPFVAIVIPAADDQHLGGSARDDSLLPRSLADELGLPSARSRRDHELLAFAQALRCPRVTLLRRRGDPVEPLAESPLVERLRLALAAHGRDLRDWRDPRVERTLPRAPVRRSAAAVPPAALPQRLSASAFEALRACPYRFFARSVLRLGEAEELDEDIEKRDYGNWLHKVLHAFHLERSDAAGAGAARDVEGETTRLRAIGDAKLAEEGIDPAAFLPFGASFSVFAPRYVAWLHERERAGWSWLAGEAEFVATPQELEGVELYGRIDRIDRHPGPAGAGQPVLELIDYKTGSASRLKESMLESFEDTQLAFYAALVRSTRDEPLQASYLALDGTRGIEPIAHREVETSAAALIVGAAGELARIRAGEALPPLGEGTACDYCEARGLCRRDHWTSEVEPAEPPEDER